MLTEQRKAIEAEGINLDGLVDIREPSRGALCIMVNTKTLGKLMHYVDGRVDNIMRCYNECLLNSKVTFVEVY